MILVRRGCWGIVTATVTVIVPVMSDSLEQAVEEVEGLHLLVYLYGS